MKYTFEAKRPHNHFLGLAVEIETKGEGQLTIQLPAWRPGRYELGNFAKNVKDFRIENKNGVALSYTKVSKDAWEVDCAGNDEVIVKYQYYSNELNAGATWLDENQLYVNPVNCCVYVPGREEVCTIELQVPENYKVATSLKELSKFTFEAEDFQELADSPFIASASLHHKMYESYDIRFHVWFQGEVKPDWDKLIKDFQMFTDYQMKKFGGFPVKEYHFLNQITPYRAYHGVEHQKSTVIALGPSYEIFGKLYDSLLGVSSHELYHTWNIKAIRPEEMFPYNFSRENYSRLGYVAEGVTTYMGDRTLFECGVFNRQQYFKELESLLTRHYTNDGINHYSVADSSWDTWLDGYVAGVPGRKVSIYTEGALIAYICDMRIRKETGNSRSLHDVMKELYNRTNMEKGYSEELYWDLMKQVAGVSFDDVYNDLVNGHTDFTPYLKEAMNYEGWSFEVNPSKKMAENYGLKGDWKNGSFAVSGVKEGSSADVSGIIPGDKIHSINGYRLSDDLNNWLEYFGGEEIQLSIEREGELKKIQLNQKNDNGFFEYKMKVNAVN